VLVEYTDYDTRLAAYAIIVDDQDRVLLPLWNEIPPGEWTLPGGGAELHETVQETAIREVAEETGYDVELTRLLGVDTFVVPGEQRLHPAALGRALKNVRVVFEGRIVGGELRHEADGTTDEARWIPLAEVPDLSRVSLVDTGLAFWRAARTA
jgi:8-oxo-dGTP diphosphatase